MAVITPGSRATSTRGRRARLPGGRDQPPGLLPRAAAARHAIVEGRRNLARLLDERDAAAARAAFLEDIAAFSIVELDRVTCDMAADIAEITGVRTLDALHLAAARRVGGSAVPFLTYDLRQAQAARGLGFTVVGA